MNNYAKPIVGMLSAVVLTGCLGSAPVDSEGTTMSKRSRVGTAIVIAGEQLWSQSGDLMTVVKNRVASMQIRRSRNDPCPEIVIRGRKSIQGPSDPKIYVDGTPAANTCILEMLTPTNVERVEVYPSGISRRPGYFTDPNGLILVFSRDGEP